MTLSRAQRAFARANDRQFGPQFGIGGRLWDVYRPAGGDGDTVTYTLLGTWAGFYRKVTITRQGETQGTPVAEEQWICHGSAATVFGEGDLVVGELASGDIIVSRENDAIAALVEAPESVAGYERWQAQPCAKPTATPATPVFLAGMAVGGLIPLTYGASYGG